MTQPASAMMQETAAKCRASFAGSEIEKACPELRKLLDLAACDLESAATIIHHNIEAKSIARPLDDWHEDIGPVLWWFFPVSEAPWVGTPNDDDFLHDYYTHWTPLPALPVQPVT